MDDEEFGLADDAAAAVSTATAATTTTRQPEVVPVKKLVAALESKKSNETTTSKVAAKTVATTETPVAVSKAAAKVETTGISGDLSMEDKKRQRSERFQIPLVTAPESATKPIKAVAEKKSDKRPKTTSTTVEKPLLSKEEIEKQLERAAKFGGVDQAKIDELKAMKRAHRFSKA